MKGEIEHNSVKVTGEMVERIKQYIRGHSRAGIWHNDPGAWTLMNDFEAMIAARPNQLNTPDSTVMVDREDLALLWDMRYPPFFYEHSGALARIEALLQQQTQSEIRVHDPE